MKLRLAPLLHTILPLSFLTSVSTERRVFKAWNFPDWLWFSPFREAPLPGTSSAAPVHGNGQ